jgi:2-phosphosulfolactate phosphatase
MEFEYTTNETCHTASGLVVVIDVLRAFSNAAYAFSMGAESIMLVSSVQDALALKAQMPAALVIGEVDGRGRIRFWQLATETVNNLRRLISAGHRAWYVAKRETLLQPTVVAKLRAAIQHLNRKVTFVITGRYLMGG